MGILAEDVTRVRTETDFVAIASERMSLKRTGRQWTGLCPFHAEKTPSFSVNGELGVYHCHGCGASGDVITFVRETEHLDFVGAVEKLAGKANIQLRYDDVSAGRERQKRDALYEVMAAAVEWYHRRLMNGTESAPARGYLRDRGYDGLVVRDFQIGWAPEGWDELARALDVDDKTLADAGLGFVNRLGKQQDAFRGRIMFPIFDVAGRAVAFGGRVLPGSDDPAKYKNSSETPIYSKRRTLYGLNWAKEDAVKSGEIVVCEGYTDVIAFSLAGAPRAVATCGTAVTEEHLRVMRPFASRIVLAYDADAAGQAAAERFYAWERDLDLSLHVLALPKGSDPGDMARRNPAGLVEALSAAKSFLEFRVQRALDAGDLTSAEGKARAAERALEVVGEHPNELVRGQFLATISDRIGIPADQLARSLQQGTRGAPIVVRTATPVSGPESEALKLAIHDPAAVAGRLHEVLFTDPAHRDAFLAIAGGEPLPAAIESAPPDAASLLRRLAVEDVEADATDVLACLTRIAVDEAIARLARGAIDEGAVSAIAWLKLTREELLDDSTRVGATEALVGWLAKT